MVVWRHASECRESRFRCLCRFFNKCSSDDRNQMAVPAHIAVLGAGITGLSSAFHLSRRFPKSLITLIEKQPRLGGWIRSERVEIQSKNGTETIILEGGPRSLRPNAKSILELVRSTSDDSVNYYMTHRRLDQPSWPWIICYSHLEKFSRSQISLSPYSWHSWTHPNSILGIFIVHISSSRNFTFRSIERGFSWRKSSWKHRRWVFGCVHDKAVRGTICTYFR